MFWQDGESEVVFQRLCNPKKHQKGRGDSPAEVTPLSALFEYGACFGPNRQFRAIIRRREKEGWQYDDSADHDLEKEAIDYCKKHSVLSHKVPWVFAAYGSKGADTRILVVYSEF
ncbi:hypothetical protein BT69DRAFT_1296749 [Atractiella rhizophila]|nr:hypothetical protein BT69DRAFT_1296749 [Atractiella rhizophila]